MSEDVDGCESAGVGAGVCTDVGVEHRKIRLD